MTNVRQDAHPRDPHRDRADARPKTTIGLHGGYRTGLRTLKELERSRHARWKHGAYSRETRAILVESPTYFFESPAIF
jgi:hypothetical protein